MNDLPQRRTEDLRRGRISLPGARYFITVCARRPASVLTEKPVGAALQVAVAGLFPDDDAAVLCSTVMPDHLHLLVQLGERLSVGRVVAKFKSATTVTLREKGLDWQRNFFEHRLRPTDKADLYARYIFMNPYRAGLLAANDVWPWWRLNESVEFDFLQHLRAGVPPNEWMDESVEDMGLLPEHLGLDP